MSNFIDRLYMLTKSAEIKDQNEEGQSEEEKTKPLGFWARRLSFIPSSEPCEEDAEAPTSTTPPSAPPLMLPKTNVPEEILEEEGEAEAYICPPSYFSDKFKCVYYSAKNGLREGALAGIFFGGTWGIYKYMDAVLNPGKTQEKKDEKEENKKKGKSDNNDEKEDNQPSNSPTSDNEATTSRNNNSDVNSNIIFLSAANGAIFMGVLCTLLCGAKASIYCT